MADLVAQTEHRENQISRILMMLKEKFSSLYGEEVGLYSKSEMYNGEFVHRNVFAPTLVRTDKNHLLVHINIRFAYGTAETEIITRLREVAEAYGETPSIQLYASGVRQQGETVYESLRTGLRRRLRQKACVCPGIRRFLRQSHAGHRLLGADFFPATKIPVMRTMSTYRSKVCWTTEKYLPSH